jgi:cyclopropane fatty-acyl-phospholipid synthase-like methyltransferase
MRTLIPAVAVLALALVLEGPAVTAQQADKPVRPPDIYWVPTQDPVVDAMLKMAKVSKTDVVYDLGCGDGKIVIAAARQYGARGVGIDIDPQRIKEANANAAKAGVADRVRFVLGDIYDPAVKFDEATVVTLYLLQSLNEKLRPRLQAELKPGTRVVSNTFSMGAAWPEERKEVINGTNVYFWTIAGKK